VVIGAVASCPSPAAERSHAEEEEAVVTETSPLTGSCHCRAIRATLHTSKPAGELEVRSCTCSFCARHGAQTVSDPAGRATFEIDGAALSYYRFETRTGTSLICNRCGTYAGVILEDGDAVWSVINVRGLAVPEFKDRAGDPVNYEGETPDQRIARRKSMWTPTEIVWVGGDAGHGR
jgi:hypothetical protein